MFANAILTALFASAAVAAPAASSSVETVVMPETMPEAVAFSEEKALTGEIWTVKNLKRYCNPADTECIWKYQIDTYNNNADPYHCVYTVKGSPASATDVVPADGITCEVFSIQQGYDPSGFTVIVPLHPSTGRRIYAGFTDEEYANYHTAPTKNFEVSNS